MNEQEKEQLAIKWCRLNRGELFPEISDVSTAMGEIEDAIGFQECLKVWNSKKHLQYRSNS